MDYPVRRVLTVLVLIIPLLSGCAGSLSSHKHNEIPASVYRNSLHDIFINTPSHHNIRQSIFKPEFLGYLAYLVSTSQTLDEHALRGSINRWNAVASEKSEQIHYNPVHFMRVASLHREGNNLCTRVSECTISLEDINILRTWLSWRLNYIVTIPHTTIDTTQLSLLNPSKQPRLQTALQKLSHNQAGVALIQQALDSGLVIRLGQLQGSHGYYDFNEHTITLDPSVVNYEFNLRYLVHELLHACNTAEENSITEEVLAELIGLRIQNQITGIRFELNPYLVLVEHVLHPEYGQLSFNNDIYGELAIAGIEL